MFGTLQFDGTPTTSVMAESWVLLWSGGILTTYNRKPQAKDDTRLQASRLNVQRNAATSGVRSMRAGTAVATPLPLDKVID